MGGVRLLAHGQSSIRVRVALVQRNDRGEGVGESEKLEKEKCCRCVLNLRSTISRLRVS